MKFQCKICKTVWELATFAQCDEIQKTQCSAGHPFQCCILRAVINES